MSQRGLLLNCLKIENSLGKKTPLEQKTMLIALELRVAGSRRHDSAYKSIAEQNYLLVHFHLNLLIPFSSHQ